MTWSRTQDIYLEKSYRNYFKPARNQQQKLSQIIFDWLWNKFIDWLKARSRWFFFKLRFVLYLSSNSSVSIERAYQSKSCVMFIASLSALSPCHHIFLFIDGKIARANICPAFMIPFMASAFIKKIHITQSLVNQSDIDMLIFLEKLGKYDISSTHWVYYVLYHIDIHNAMLFNKSINEY